MKTYSVKKDEITRKWYKLDADGEVLGRLASNVARILRGKHKTIYTPHLDTGDHVIIVNAEKIVLSGKKFEQKNYYHHTGYMGGIKHITAKGLMETKPEEIIKKAVKGMLPKTALGRQMFSKLKVYTGSEHNQHAQKPEELKFTSKKSN